MRKIKRQNFYIAGEADGDDDVASFIESCHTEFYNQRVDLQDGLIDTMDYELLVKVEVELVKVDEDDN